MGRQAKLARQRNKARARARNRPQVQASGRIPLTDPSTYGERVTVTISSYQDPPGALRRATESILDQTYENIQLVVCSDGDPEALREIDDIEDPRLVLYTFEENRGQFYAHDVVLRATADPFFAIQDGDDLSPPHRIARQVELLVNREGDLVVNRLRCVGGKRFGIPPRIRPGDEMRVPGSHVGMFKTQALLDVGGYYNGLRMGYDSLVVALVHRFGRTVATQEFLYDRTIRAGSMTQKRSTGMRSQARAKARGKLLSLRKSAEQICRKYEDRDHALKELRGLLAAHMDVPLEQREHDVQAIRALLCPPRTPSSAAS